VKHSLLSVDLFCCESKLLRSHWVMVVMDVFTRRIIGIGVERADLCGVSVCHLFNQIVAGKSPPRHLSSNHDPLFRFHHWLANLRILEVEEVKSDKIFHDSTLFPQPRHHICIGEASGNAPQPSCGYACAGVPLTIEPKPFRRNVRACPKPDIRPDTCGAARQCFSYPTIQ
jgi:hypothetical protein